MIAHFLLGVTCIIACTYGQQFGPVPPRPQQFPGAALVQQPRPNFRQRPSIPRTVPEAIQPVDQPQFNQFRRPQPLRKFKPQPLQPQVIEQPRTNLIDDTFPAKVTGPTPVPQPQPQKLTPRPVEEEVNEEDDIPTTVVTTPSTTTYAVPLRSAYPPAPAPLQPAQVQPQFQRSQFVQPSGFRPAAPQVVPNVQPIPLAQPVQPLQPLQPVQPVQPVQPLQYTGAPLQGRQLLRQQARPVQPTPVAVNRQQIQQIATPQIPASPETVLQDDQFYRQVPARQFKKQEPVRQQIIEPRQPIVRQPEVVRQQPAREQVDYTRPAQRDPHVKTPQREKKPVVQTIRKYHEEHEDGSITWGYENDDGSFKEETIGVDCVTRGKYGYYDPDGVKREYTYQTGIPCDRTQEAEEAASNQGFIDYTNNKYVLPNGDEIDLEAMVKNRARKPVPQYRN